MNLIVYFSMSWVKLGDLLDELPWHMHIYIKKERKKEKKKNFFEAFTE
jgi:hypothetical protein